LQLICNRQATDSYARSRVNCVPKRRGRKRNIDFADAGRRFVVWQYVSFKRAWQRRDPLYKRTLAIREKAFGAHHHYVGNSLHNLALLYFKQGLYTQAEPLYERSLSIWYRTLGPDHPYVATCFEDLAALYRATNRDEEAETLEQRAVRIRALQR
jgi:tetratricopeptide (TPR) repeat protein